jgi:hypothetical protein
MSFAPRALRVGFLFFVCCAAALVSTRGQEQDKHGEKQEPDKRQEEKEREEEERKSKDVLSVPLEELAEGRRPLDSLHIRVRWRDLSAELYGRGVGVWKGHEQFRFPSSSIRPLLDALRIKGFAEMPTFYGTEDTEPPRVIGEVSVTIGQATQSVTQMDGKQSEDLRALADQALAIARRYAAKSVSVKSLDEGLRKLEVGQLEPEMLELVVSRRKESAGPVQPQDGWILHLAGRAASVRPFSPKGGYGEPLQWVVPAADFKKLVGFLRRGNLGVLPVNLYGAEYTDFRIQVLNQAKSVMARRFANLDPQTHGEKQKAFDRVFEEVQRLARRALREGHHETSPD